MVQNQGRTSKAHPTQDEYDDLMISNIELTTTDDNDENYTPMFVRSKQENFLYMNNQAKQSIQQVLNVSHRPMLQFKTPSNISITSWQASATTPSIATGTYSEESWDGESPTSSLDKYLC